MVQGKPRIRPPDIGRPKLRISNIYREKANSTTKTLREEEVILKRVIPNWNKLPGWSGRYAPNVNGFSK